MPWHPASVDQAGTGHALVALLKAQDELLLAELERRGFEPKDVASALGAHFPDRSRAQEQALLAAGYINEAIAAGKLNRDALVRSVLTDYWGTAGQIFRELAARGEPVDAEALAACEHAARPLVQLDDGSDRTIYEQIMAQVQEAIATGRLQPGDRLPTVRELADQLGIAPGTVGRAYSELERQTIVVTQGARGTRVAGRATAAPRAVKPVRLGGLLRPAAVAAFHMGATAGELRGALEEAMKDIFPRNSEPGA